MMMMMMMVVMFLVLHNDYLDGHQRRDVDSPSSEYLIIMKTYSGLNDDFDDNDDDDDEYDDMYIMMKCLSVCNEKSSLPIRPS